MKKEARTKTRKNYVLSLQDEGESLPNFFMWLLETIFWIGFIVTSIVLREHLLFRLGGGLVFIFLSGIGAVGWRIRGQNKTFYMYLQCLSFLFIAINFLVSPVETWQEAFLRTGIFLSSFFMVVFLVAFFGVAHLRRVAPTENGAEPSFLKQDPYSKLPLFFRSFLYGGTPTLAFLAVAYDNTQILPYYRGMMAYSMLAGTLIYALFVKKSNKSSDLVADDRITFPRFVRHVIIGSLLLGFVYELCNRRYWFFYLSASLFFLVLIKVLPAYVRRSEPSFPPRESSVDGLLSWLLKRILIETGFVLPYLIVLVLFFGLFAEVLK